jgi:hypothetical protein
MEEATPALTASALEQLEAAAIFGDTPRSD